MSLAQLIEPSIEYAERGFPVSEIIAADWSKEGELHSHDSHFARAWSLVVLFLRQHERLLPPLTCVCWTVQRSSG